MQSINVTPRQLATILREFEGTRPDRVQAVLLKAAWAGAEALASVAPVGVTGQFKTRIRAEKTGRGSRIVLDAPYAGIIELGARPHTPPLAPLYEWFMRKVGLSSSEAYKAARGLQQKIKRFGQAPTYFVRRRLSVLRRILAAEILAELQRPPSGF